MKRKMVALLLTLATSVSLLGGCGTGGDTASSGDAGDKEEPVEISILMYGIDAMSGVQKDSVTKAVEEEIGVTMNIISTSGMDILAEMNAMIASDDLPDIVCGVNDDQRSLLLKSEQVIPLDDLVEQYGGEITNKEAGKTGLELSKEFYSDDSGQLYFIPFQTGEDRSAGFPTTAPYIRWDVYEKIGAPPVQDMDDLLNVLKQMQDAYPETEDGKKVYAISGCLADSAWNTYSMTAAEAFIGFRKFGYGLVGVNTYNPSELIYALETPESPTWRLFEFYNKAYQMGILDPDSLTMKWDQWTEKIAAGQVLYSPLDFSSTVVMNDPNKVFLPVPFENYENDSFTASYNYALGSFTYAITKRCEHPEKAMELLNFAWSYDGASLFENGVQGETWDIIDGKPQMLEEYVQARIDGTADQILFGAFYGPFMNEDTDEPINLTRTSAYYEKYVRTEAAKEYCEMYGVESPIENFTKVKNHVYEVVWDSIYKKDTDELENIDNNIQLYFLTNIPKVVAAESDEEFAEMREQIMTDINAMGAEELVAALKETYDSQAPRVLEILGE